jgi:hypothetical protein
MKKADQGSNVMKSALEAAKRTVSWSTAKQEYANRVISSGSTGHAPSQSSEPSGKPLQGVNSASGKHK